MKTFVDYMSTVGSYYLDYAHFYLLYGAAFFFTLLLVITKKSKMQYFSVGISVLIVAESLLLYNYFIASGVLFLGALIFFHFAKNESFENSWISKPKRISKEEILVLFGILFIGTFFRFYELNRIVKYFEGELAYYSAGATSLHGIFLANKGVSGPWSPLGLLYYLPIYLTTSLFGTTLWALRSSSALVGVATIPIFYILARKFAGKKVALLGSFLYALDPLHIGWSRTDIHPHGVTTWPTLLLCIALYNSIKTKDVFWYLVLSLCMGLVWHQYPSGQSAVVIPIITLCIYIFANKFKVDLQRKLYLFVLLGIALWFLGLPLSYFPAEWTWEWSNPFTLTSQRASWGNTSEAMSFFEKAYFVIAIALKHTAIALNSIFHTAPYIHHQDFVPTVNEMPTRVVPWLLTPFIIGGFVILFWRIRSIESCILIAWVIAALLPAILSERPYPKRMSTLFPALDLIAAVSIVYVKNGVTGTFKKRFASFVLSMSLVGYFIFITAAWFSGKQWQYGVPPEEAVAKEIGSMVEPSTIIIADIWKDYDQGKMVYLLLDDLADKNHRPNLLYLTHLHIANLEELVENPKEAPTLLMNYPNRLWFYRWTKLQQQWDEIFQTKEWKKVMFIFQERGEIDHPNTAQKEKALSLCKNPVAKRFESKGSFSMAYDVLICDL